MSPGRGAAGQPIRRQRRAPALLAGAILVLLAAAGCTGSSNLPEDIRVLRTSTEGLSPAAAALLEEAQRHARTRLTGAGIGGAAGLLAGIYPARTTGSGGGAGAVYAAAGAVGSAVGYAYGEYIAARSARATMDQEKLRLLSAAAQTDADGYRRNLDTARQSVDESEAVVSQVRHQPVAAPERRLAYRQQARNLEAVTAALRQALKEIEGNLEVMQADLMEVVDVEAINRAPLDSADLRRQAAAFQDTHAGIVAQYQRAEAVAQAMPPGDRPAIPPWP